jgi:hypothetical protein
LYKTRKLQQENCYFLAACFPKPISRGIDHVTSFPRAFPEVVIVYKMASEHEVVSSTANAEKHILEEADKVSVFLINGKPTVWNAQGT